MQANVKESNLALLGFPKNSRAPEAAAKVAGQWSQTTFSIPRLPAGALYLGSAKPLIHRGSDHLAGSGDMLAHEIAGAPGVAALERGEDQRMFLHRFGSSADSEKSPGNGRDGRERSDRAWMSTIAELPENRTIASCSFWLSWKYSMAILCLVPLLDPDLQLTQRFQIGSRHSNRRQLGRHALDAAQGLKQIDDSRIDNWATRARRAGERVRQVLRRRGLSALRAEGFARSAAAGRVPSR